jgi:hypothetical protein
MHSFSLACWGLGQWVIAFAMMFVAIAALVSKSIRPGWIRGILAGMAVGIGLMEGFDVGAINSLYIGVFALFVGLVGEKITARTVGKSVLVTTVVAVFAALTAAHILWTLIGTQFQGTALNQQNKMTKEDRWMFITQWSLPKKEVLRILIPGLFGYRMDTEGTGITYEKSYWGTVAQSPGYDDKSDKDKYHVGLARHSGSGEYAGIFVLVVAVFGIAQSFRKQNSPFGSIEKRFIWFWSAVALLSLLFALGRHSPFFLLIFPFHSLTSIRSTLKHLNPFHIALLILFGYGLEAMVRRYFESGKNNLATAFENKWKMFSGGALGLSLLGWMIYASSKNDVLTYLRTHFSPDIAAKIVDFSMGEMASFILFFSASVALVWMILSGKFAGKIRLATILMAGLIIVDLSHADVHWIVYQNYKEKYQSNPIIDILRDKPYEHRVVGMLPLRVNETLSSFQQFYYVEWLQHHFYYYNIQTLDIPQEPRPAADNLAYRGNFLQAGAPGLVRMWQLANVQYLFGLAGGFTEQLNQQLDPEQKRFKHHTSFGLSQERPGGPYLAQTNSTGPFALIEFTGALPRAKIYSNWQVVPEDQETLQKLVDPKFDPLQNVLIANKISSPDTNNANANPGTVQFVSYRPKRIELSAKVEAPSILLLNDKFNQHWKVFVDGQKKPLLRANYIMRGVQLEKGEHKIEFRFQPPLTTLYISLAACAIGLGILGFSILTRMKSNSPASNL